MKLPAFYITGVLLFFLCFSDAIFAQDTTDLNTYLRFQTNLNELDDFAGDEIALIQIEKLPVRNFNNAFQKLNLSFFETPVQRAGEYYNFLNNLPEQKKEQLIRRYYFDASFFTKVFEEAALPLELKYFAPAFSAMNPNAVGEDGRAGVWQLTHFQGVLNGLIVTRLVDERLNNRLAIEKYIKEIQQNIEVFGTTELAMLAQWYGRTKIQNAVSFAGDRNSLNEILTFLPETATDKIAAFQAMAVFLNNNKVVESRGAVAQNAIPDTVEVFNQLHLKQISEVLNIAEQQLISLNPQYKFEIIPASSKGHKIALPQSFGNKYITWQDSIFNALDSSLFEITAQTIEYPPSPTRQYLGEPVKDLEIEGKTKIKYRLKTGDVLGIIAERYDVRVADLKYWNNITNERRIQAGKNIDVFVDDDQVEYYQNLEKIEKQDVAPANNFAEQIQQASTLKFLENLTDTPSIEYEVKSGESPYTIAKKFDGITPDEILLWNNIDDARKIQIGQKLTIYIKE